MKTKICSNCKKEKSISEFYKNKRSKDKLRSACIECEREYYKEYRKKHHEKKRKYMEEYRKEYPEKIKESNKKSYKKHPHRRWAITTISQHRKRDYNVVITNDELTELAKKTINCPICNVKLNWKAGNKNGIAQYNSPSLDRKDNEKILNKNNVWIICNRCNLGKQDRTMKEFVDYCKMVVDKDNFTIFKY